MTYAISHLRSRSITLAGFFILDYNIGVYTGAFVDRNGDEVERLEIDLSPIDPAQAVVNETTITTIKNIERAVQILSTITSAGQAPDINAIEAAQTVLDIQRRSAERQNTSASRIHGPETAEKDRTQTSHRHGGQLSCPRRYSLSPPVRS